MCVFVVVVFAYLLGHSALEICYCSLGFRELCLLLLFCWYNKEEGVCVCVFVCVCVNNSTQASWASLVTQTVKNLPAMQKTWV